VVSPLGTLAYSTKALQVADFGEREKRCQHEKKTRLNVYVLLVKQRYQARVTSYDFFLQTKPKYTPVNGLLSFGLKFRYCRRPQKCTRG
jgi:hypothetical protein